MGDEQQFELDGTGVTAADLMDREEPQEDTAPATKAKWTCGNSVNPECSKPRLRSRNQSTYLYFDLETVPDESRIEQFGLPELPTWADCSIADADIDGLLGGTVKDIEEFLFQDQPGPECVQELVKAELAGKARKGVLAAMDKCRADRSRALSSADDRKKLLSITPEYCQVVALGFAVGDTEVDSFTADYHSEHEMLGAFWSMAIECKSLVGFNILHFDLPVIFVRSMLLGVDPTRTIDTKPWSNDIIDLYVRRFGTRGNTGKGPGKLKDLARLHGIEVPAGDVDGGDVAELLKNDPEKLGEYVRSDVEITRALHRKYQGFFC